MPVVRCRCFPPALAASPLVGLLLLAIMLAGRLAGLAERPFHHDESLFAFHGWRLARGLGDGGAGLDPLLHGPLQLYAIAAALGLGDGLGWAGDFAARLPAALAGAALAPLVWLGLRGRRGGGEALVSALALGVSPALWYYGRFCRNESLFVLAAWLVVWGLGSAWRGGRRGGGGTLAGACLAGAALLGMKENVLFLIFNGLSFLGLWALRERWDGWALGGWRGGWAGAPRAGLGRRLAWGARRHAAPLLLAGAAGLLLLEAAYTNGFRRAEGFPEGLARQLAYWAGQHREHRIFGSFWYHLRLLALNEPGALLLVAGGVWTAARARGRRVAWALGPALALGAWELALTGWGRERLLPALHMQSGGQLAFATALGWATLVGAWQALGAGRGWRACLVWWAGLSLLQYSYAGEKVPWLSVHVVLPLLLLAAELWAAAWRGAHGGRRAGLLALLVLALGFNAFQGARLCFWRAADPTLALVYNQTTPTLRAEAGRIRDWCRGWGAERAAVWVQGEAQWPLLWYLREEPVYWVGPEAETERLPNRELPGWLVADPDWLESRPELAEAFALRRVALRRAWVPGALHPLRPWRWPWPAQSAFGRWWLERQPSGQWLESERLALDAPGAATELEAALRGRYGLGAWRRLAAYALWRRPWDSVSGIRDFEVLAGPRRPH